MNIITRVSGSVDVECSTKQKETFAVRITPNDEYGHVLQSGNCVAKTPPYIHL